MLYRIHYSAISASVGNAVIRDIGIFNGMSPLINDFLDVHIFCSPVLNLIIYLPSFYFSSFIN